MHMPSETATNPRPVVRLSALLLCAMLIPCVLHGEGLAGTYSQGALDLGGGPNPNLSPTQSTMGQTLVAPDVSSVYVDPTSSSIDLVSAPSPIGIDRTTFRYFSYNGSVTPLIGVSADAACHMHLANAYGDLCTFDPTKPSYYVNVLNDVAAKNLNKIRLWVAINGGSWAANSCTQGAPPNPADQPFLYRDATFANECTTANPCPNGIGHWYLDQENMSFFGDLAQVVAYAQSKGIFVEVTLFAPWIGVFELGPWSSQHGRVSTSPTTPVGFPDRSYFVRCSGTCANATSPIEAVRGYQANVIRWTVDALWSYPNVYWEVANEPEDWAPISSCGEPVPQAAEGSDPSFNAWQEAVVGFLAGYEDTTYVATGMLARPHLIAVQPFSIPGTTSYLTNANVGVINGHYTTVSASHGGQGAIQMVQTDGNQSRLLGFNEGKISGSTAAGTNVNVAAQEATCGLNAASGRVDCTGEPESARAEAWEFMLSRGASVDHFGYYYNSTYGSEIRQQLGNLRSFISALPLRQMVSTSQSNPGWVNIGAYAQDAMNNSKYWAALQPSVSATSVVYALYIHHSAPRQDGRGAYLNDGGYLPQITPGHYYAESLRLCLGSAAGSFQAQWIDPATNAHIGLPQTISWPGSSSCANGGIGSVALNPPPGPSSSYAGYLYDIALQITKN